MAAKDILKNTDAPQPEASDLHALSERSERLLAFTLKRLLLQASKVGHWGDVRGTADSLIAISECLDRNELVRLKQSACQWLIKGAEINPLTMHWEEEVWDTAIGVLGLSSSGSLNEEHVVKAVRWLEQRYVNRDGNWNDEPWETLWAMIAILRICDDSRDIDVQIDFERSMQWLISHVDKRTGRLINAHYQAMFLILASELEKAPAKIRRKISQAVEREVVECRRIIIKSLLDRELLGEADGLWSFELWSNSLVLTAIAEKMVERKAWRELGTVLKWFEIAIQQENVLTEDLAFACTALVRTATQLSTAMDLDLPNRIALAMARFEPGSQELHLIGQLRDRFQDLEIEKVQDRIAGRDLG